MRDSLAQCSRSARSTKIVFKITGQYLYLLFSQNFLKRLSLESAFALTHSRNKKLISWQEEKNILELLGNRRREYKVPVCRPIFSVYFLTQTDKSLLNETSVGEFLSVTTIIMTLDNKHCGVASAEALAVMADLVTYLLLRVLA